MKIKSLATILMIPMLLSACGAEDSQPTPDTLESTGQEIRGGQAVTDASIFQIRTTVRTTPPSTGVCSATMIRPNIALTAAHCLPPGTLPGDVSGTDAQGANAPVASFIRSEEADLALLRFYGDLGRPTRELGTQLPFPGDTLTIRGLGRSSDTETGTLLTGQSTLRFYAAGGTVSSGGDDPVLTPIGDLTLVADPAPEVICPGDSGGPVLHWTPDPNFVGPVQVETELRIVGVHSGTAGGTDSTPCSTVTETYHSNTVIYLPWIERAISVLSTLSGQPDACPDGMPIVMVPSGGEPFRAGNESECIIGTEGNDNIRGGNGDDIIFGLGGDDRLYGNSGNDLIFGGDGRDIIFGNTDADTLMGGAGNDRLSVCAGDNVGCEDGGPEFVDGGSGSDTIHIMAGDVALGGPGNDQIFAIGDSPNGGFGGHIVGDSGRDTIRLDGRGFTVCPGPGADRIRGNQSARNRFFRGADDDFSSPNVPAEPAMRESCYGFESAEYAPYYVGYDFDGDGAGGNHGWDSNHCLCEPLPVRMVHDYLPPNQAGPAQAIIVQRMPTLEPLGDCEDTDDSTTCN